MVARVCDSAACICGCSLCVFFVLNLNADLGDFGDFGLRGDLGLSMKSCSSSTTVGSGSVSGCGVDFRAILPLLFFRGLFFSPLSIRRRPWVAGLLMSRVHSLQVPKLCHNSQDGSAGGLIRVVRARYSQRGVQCFRCSSDEAQVQGIRGLAGRLADRMFRCVLVLF
jgi:hypothetical protein